MTPMKYVVKPLMCGIAMGIAAFAIYKAIMLVFNETFVSNLAATVISIAVAAILYFFMVFKLRILSADEVKQLPAGNKIYRGLVKLKLYSGE